MPANFVTGALEEPRTVTWTGAIRWPARPLSGCAVKANAAAPKALGGGGGPADWSSLSSRHAAAMTVASARRRSILMALASHRKRRTAPANTYPALISGYRSRERGRSLQKMGNKRGVGQTR